VSIVSIYILIYRYTIHNIDIDISDMYIASVIYLKDIDDNTFPGYSYNVFRVYRINYGY
jgi:hypothetical protein